MRRRGQAIYLSIPALICTCLALLVLSGCGGASPGSSGGNTCSTTPAAPGCAYLSNLRFDVADEAQMHVKDTQILKVTLYSVSNLLIANTRKSNTGVPAENATVTTTSANPVIGGTPATTLQNAFGPGYQPYATVTLSAGQNPFVVSPIGDVSTPKSLNVADVQWEWQLQSKDVGQYLFNVEIDAIWKPLPPSSNLPIQGPLSLGNAQFRVDVLAANAVITTPAPIITPITIITPTSTTPVGAIGTPVIVTLISLLGAIAAMVAAAAIFIHNRKPNDNDKNMGVNDQPGAAHGPAPPHK